MNNAKKVLSVILGCLFSIAIIFSGMPAKAKTNEIIPIVKFSGELKTEYFVGERVEFNINAANYGGKVEYRVVLWNDATKSYTDLWNTSNGYPGRYYTKWQPTGNTNFTLGWTISEPGSYRITVYVKRVGIKSEAAAVKGMNCDSYIGSGAFVVKQKVTDLNEEGKSYGSKDENQLETFDGDRKITAKNISLSNAIIAGNLEITGDRVTLKNVQVMGKITIDVGNNGVSNLEGVNAKNIEVKSAGRIGVLLKDVKLDSLDVNCPSQVKIELDGETSIAATTASGSVIFNKKNGTLGEVKISKLSNIEPTVEFIGEIRDKVIVNNGATVRAKDKSFIENLVLNTVMALETVKLEGNYKLVEINRPGRLEIKTNSKVERLVARSFADVYVATNSIINMIDKGNNNVDVYLDGKKTSTSTTTKLKTMGIRNVKVLNKTTVAVEMEKLDGVTFIFDGVSLPVDKIAAYDGEKYVLTVKEMVSGYNYSIAIIKAGYNVYTKTDIAWTE